MAGLLESIKSALTTDETKTQSTQHPSDIPGSYPTEDPSHGTHSSLPDRTQHVTPRTDNIGIATSTDTKVDSYGSTVHDQVTSQGGTERSTGSTAIPETTTYSTGSSAIPETTTHSTGSSAIPETTTYSTGSTTIPETTTYSKTPLTQSTRSGDYSHPAAGAGAVTGTGAGVAAAAYGAGTHDTTAHQGHHLSGHAGDYGENYDVTKHPELQHGAHNESNTMPHLGHHKHEKAAVTAGAAGATGAATAGYGHQSDVQTGPHHLSGHPGEYGESYDAKKHPELKQHGAHNEPNTMPHMYSSGHQKHDKDVTSTVLPGAAAASDRRSSTQLEPAQPLSGAPGHYGTNYNIKDHPELLKQHPDQARSAVGIGGILSGHHGENYSEVQQREGSLGSSQGGHPEKFAHGTGPLSGAPGGYGQQYNAAQHPELSKMHEHEGHGKIQHEAQQERRGSLKDRLGSLVPGHNKDRHSGEHPDTSRNLPSSTATKEPIASSQGVHSDTYSGAQSVPKTTTAATGAAGAAGVAGVGGLNYGSSNPADKVTHKCVSCGTDNDISHYFKKDTTTTRTS